MRTLILSLLFISSFALANPHSNKILIVLSAAKKMTLQNGQTVPVGFYMAELTEPLEAITKAGLDYDIATPAATVAQPDPMTTQRLFHPFYIDGSYERALNIVATNEKLKKPLNLDTLSESDLDQYVAVFVPGGNAPILDLAKSRSLAKVLFYFHNKQAPTGLLCHGAGTTQSLRSVQPWPYKGYRMTVMSNLEESIIEKTVLKAKVPYARPADELKKLGGVVYNLPAFNIPLVLKDRELITGQNEFASREFGRVFVKAILKYQGK